MHSHSITFIWLGFGRKEEITPRQRSLTHTLADVDLQNIHTKHTHCALITMATDKEAEGKQETVLGVERSASL